MQVTNVRVSFLREKQPAQYEKAAPAVEFVATLDQGDDHRSVARSLMIDATSVVYAGIGYDVPAKVAQALASGDVPTELSVATETVDATEAAAETPEEAAEEKKTRGRPRGSKNTAPKKETAAAKRKREAAEAKAAEAAEADDGIPGDDEPAAISTGEARIGPEDTPEDHGIPGDDDGVPGDDEVPGEDETPAEEAEGEFTPKDLHILIMSHVNATPRTLSVANAKQVLAHFKVARAQDLTDEQALEGKALVEKMVAAASKGN